MKLRLEVACAPWICREQLPACVHACCRFHAQLLPRCTRNKGPINPRWDSPPQPTTTQLFSLSNMFFLEKRHVEGIISMYRYGDKNKLNTSPSLLSLTSGLDRICVRLFCVFGAVHGSDPHPHYQHTGTTRQLLGHFGPNQIPLPPSLRLTDAFVVLGFGTTGENLLS